MNLPFSFEVKTGKEAGGENQNPSSQAIISVLKNATGSAKLTQESAKKSTRVKTGEEAFLTSGKKFIGENMPRSSS